MPEPDCETSVLGKVCGALATEVSAKYKLSPERALGLVTAELTAFPGFVAGAEAAATVKAFERTRLCKDAVSKAKKAIYFELRKYKQDEVAFEEALCVLEAAAPGVETPELLAAQRAIVTAHVSTAERIGHLDALLDALEEPLAGARAVIDLGAGTFPLVFDFARFPGIDYYRACDRDAVAMRAVAAWGAWRGDGRLTAEVLDFADGKLPGNGGECDVALMLKLIPVVKRRVPKALALLGNIAARRLVVTGSREGMVKRRDITGRERRVLEDFARDYGWRISGSFETPDEIGLVLERAE